MSDPPPPPPQPPPPPDPPANGGGTDSDHPDRLPPTGITSKRQRRPSVRLGDIGEQPAAVVSSDSHHLRRSKHLKVSSSSSHRDSTITAAKHTSKTRALTNLDHQDAGEERGGDENVELAKGARRGGSRDEKMRRLGGPISRLVRTNWFSKVEEGVAIVEQKSNGGDDVGDEGNYRDYDEEIVREDSFSPRRDQSRARFSGNRDVGVCMRDAPSETGGRDWEGGRNGLAEEDEGGVRAWLNGLGLGRYVPVFEVHEVDDEVLPLLTLEDLKDMGINAVGSRRKMYCAIQKLGKRFT